MTTWLSDANGNRCSVEYFGSQEAAQTALDSLKNCRNCTNCSECSRCSKCSECSECSGCSRCYGCSECSECSGCSRCYGCSECSECSGCSRCYGCSECSRCYECYGCSECSRCSKCYECSECSGCYGCYECSECYGCSECSRCSKCSKCSHVAWLRDEQNLQAEPGASNGPPSIPVIADIHQAIYAAASAPGALDMRNVHTCEKTHCRAGWAVALAGPAGHALENYYNWELAAMLIYDASDPSFKINPARFYDENDAAMADMKRLAEAA